MRNLSRLSIIVTSLGVLLSVAPVLLAAQQCGETARSQIEAVLDNSTNRPLIRDVVGSYGDESRKTIVEIAADANEPAKRRGQAIQLLGEYRSEAARQLLTRWLHDPRTVCTAIEPLSHYRSPDLVPALVALLDDRNVCGKVASPGRYEADLYVSDIAVTGLEHLTGQRMEQLTDRSVFTHSATEPWKVWWQKNREDYSSEPQKFLAPERDEDIINDPHYPCSVYKIAISPNGKTVFSAGKSYDPWVRAWSLETRTQAWAALNGRDDDVSSATFSPDNRLVATSTWNGAVKIYDASDGRRVRTLIPGRGVDSVAFTPDGSMLASASDDGTISLFDTRSWCEVRRFDNKEMTEGIAFSPDGSLLAAATFEQVKLWHLATASEVKALKIRPATSPKVFADAGERNAKLWRMAWQVAFSPDGRLLATASSAAIQLWDVATGKEAKNTGSGGQTGSLHFTPDGQWVVWGNDRDEIVKWNPSTGKRYRIKNEFSLGDTAMTPDGTQILSPGAGQEIAVYDLSTRRKVGQLRCEKISAAMSGTGAR